MILGLTERILVIDAETSSDVDLASEGGARYWASPETATLMLGYKWLGAAEDEAAVTDFTARRQELPDDIVAAIGAPPQRCMLAAANAPFDQEALRRIGYDTSDAKWIDVLVLAYLLGFSGRLDDVLKQTGIGVAKDHRGSQCISVFSKQRRPWHSNPDLWDDFVGYCRQDAHIEELLLRYCLRLLDNRTLRPVTRRVMGQEAIYKRINRRGIPVDRAAVRGALAIKEHETEQLLHRMRAETGLDNPNSVSQLLGWCQSQDSWLTSLRKDEVRDEIARLDEGPLRRVLRHRQEISKASVKKYDALDRATSDDGRLRGGWQFYGASRTGRVAGRTLNPANLARPMIDNPELTAECMAQGDADLLSICFPEQSIMDTLASTIRASLMAPPGKLWCVADLTSIESVGLAWLAGCDKILDLFFTGRDTYKTFAASAMGVAYDDVTKPQRTQFKPAVLGAGYKMSGGGLQAYAASMGIELEEKEAHRQVALFRAEYHEIAHYWVQLTDAAIAAVKNPGRKYRARAVLSSMHDDFGGGYLYDYRDGRDVVYYSTKEFLWCRIPSGRFLCYHRPSVQPVTIIMRDGDSFVVPEALHYYGNNQKQAGARWLELSVHAGSLAENITQALCRDVLWNGLEQAEADPGLEVVGDVYDEIMTLCDVNDAEALDRLIGYMTTPAPWMDDRFFLGADGYMANRYRKD